MSELINTKNRGSDLRRTLLTSASALALIGSLSGAPDAKADDTDRPTIWIELGGQLEQQTGQGDVFSPSFVTDNPTSLAFKPVSPLHVLKAPLFSNGANGKITFEPDGTNWVLSAAIRYGRSAGRKSFHQNHLISHTAYSSGLGYNGAKGGLYVRYRTVIQHASLTAGVQDTQRQSHAIVDFAAGKDVGLGMFGKGGVSDFNIGVRFAQFTSKVTGALQARPDAEFLISYNHYAYQYYHTRFPLAKFGRPALGQHLGTAMLHSGRSFHGVGPALSWNASLPVLGGQPGATLNVDWGANASVLFGRQRASGSHHTYAYYLVVSDFNLPRTHHSGGGSFDRARKVAVPNVGGFAGLSIHRANAEISLGYRGDFFFGAMDTGNDTRKTKTIGFYGPFASISVGFGG